MDPGHSGGGDDPDDLRENVARFNDLLARVRERKRVKEAEERAARQEAVGDMEEPHAPEHAQASGLQTDEDRLRLMGARARKAERDAAKERALKLQSERQAEQERALKLQAERQAEKERELKLQAERQAEQERELKLQAERQAEDAERQAEQERELKLQAEQHAEDAERQAEQERELKLQAERQAEQDRELKLQADRQAEDAGRQAEQERTLKLQAERKLEAAKRREENAQRLARELRQRVQDEKHRADCIKREALHALEKATRAETGALHLEQQHGSHLRSQPVPRKQRRSASLPPRQRELEVNRDRQRGLDIIWSLVPNSHGFVQDALFDMYCLRGDILGYTAALGWLTTLRDENVDWDHFSEWESLIRMI